jgi:hypothetical protein
MPVRQAPPIPVPSEVRMVARASRHSCEVEVVVVLVVVVVRPLDARCLP